MPDGKKVQKMFSNIAARYDLANILLSAGFCILWRNKLVRLISKESPNILVDLACGSGDIAFSLAKKNPNSIINAYDFCEEMLKVARRRAEKKFSNLKNIPTFSFGDCMQLPIESNSTDAISIAYGIRNFENREKGLREMARILRPGKKVFILEFTQPYFFIKPFYFIYLKIFLPFIAWIITRDKNAYDYLAGSIKDFPPKNIIKNELLCAGFKNVKSISLSTSIVAIHIGEKP